MVKEYKITKENKGSATQLIVEGKLVLANSVNIKKQFIDLLKKEKEAEIVLNNVKDIDLSFLQILLSIRKTNSKINIEMNISDEHKKLIETAGILNTLNSN